MIAKKVRRILKRVVRDMPANRAVSLTDSNAQIRAMLDRCTVDGKIGVVLSGRDCDCVSYRREYVCETWRSVAAFKREWDEHCNWLDGPESQHFYRPDEIEEGYHSRDLALEAFEDGHTHVVYA